MWVGKCGPVDAAEHLEVVFHPISRVWLGARKVVEHVAVHNPLEVAGAVVRSYGGVGPTTRVSRVRAACSGWAGFGAALVQRGDGERR